MNANYQLITVYLNSYINSAFSIPNRVDHNRNSREIVIVLWQEGPTRNKSET